MNNSLKHFLSDILDYAGLYPPASLSLVDAFNKYIQHLDNPHSWMLSKFVVGTSYLPELVKLINSDDRSPNPFLLTVVAAPSSTLAEFKEVVLSNRNEVLKTVKDSNNQISAPSLEIKLPVDAFKSDNLSELQEAIEFAVTTMDSSDLLPESIFFEIPGFEFNHSYANLLTTALSENKKWLEHSSLEHYSFSGFKIRCGGVEAFQFPPISYLSTTIQSAAKQKVPLKFTAGLHHPIRHFNDSVSTKMHGFLNVFGASILCNANQLSEDELVSILEDENASDFKFSDSHFNWRDKSVSLDQIQMLRTHSVTSFGSCSFEEPIEDLQDLTLLT